MMLLEECIIVRHQMDIPPLDFKKGLSNAICHLWVSNLEACNEGHETFRVDATLLNEVRHILGPVFWLFGGRGSFTENTERFPDFFLLVFRLLLPCWCLLDLVQSSATRAIGCESESQYQMHPSL